MRGYAVSKVSLATSSALLKSEIESAYRIAFDEYFAGSLAALRPLEDDGLVRLDADAIIVTPRGRFLVRNVAARFDAYLDRGGKLFSRAV
jgi:oxygen-independent coproporphyrinogen-3 oxidase